MAKKTNKEEVKVTKYAPVDVHDFDVIIEPIITEKTMKLLQEENKITLKVKKDANKIEIKNAFEAIFNVHVEKINVINVRPQAKRVGRYTGKVSGYKKAIVKLAAGEALDLFKETEA
jgi:large subunit ribosomal protein L23